jgi:hypothetical protein
MIGRRFCMMETVRFFVNVYGDDRPLAGPTEVVPVV